MLLDLMTLLLQLLDVCINCQFEVTLKQLYTELVASGGHLQEK
jgi:hypothetical protein